jgi:putative transposase
MQTNLKRYYGHGHLHFITFSCYRRLSLLGNAAARDVFVHALGEIRDRCGFQLVGYVVMPNHVHLLISEPATGTPSTVLKVLKQPVSRDLRKKGTRDPDDQLALALAENGDELRHFWQHRFYDFNVHSAKKHDEKLEYMHMNPVKRALVKNPEEWISSSYSYYEKLEAGIIRIDPIK